MGLKWGFLSLPSLFCWDFIYLGMEEGKMSKSLKCCLSASWETGRQSVREQSFSGRLITYHLLSQSVSEVTRRFGSFDPHPHAYTHTSYYTMNTSLLFHGNSLLYWKLQYNQKAHSLVCMTFSFVHKAIGSLVPAAARLCCCVQWESEKGERPESESRMAAGNLKKKPLHTYM